MPNIDFTKLSAAESSYFMTPALDAVGITPNDSVTFSPCRALYVGTGGDIKVEMAKDFNASGGEVVTFMTVATGSIIPISVKRIYTTDTTAANIVALY